MKVKRENGKERWSFLAEESPVEGFDSGVFIRRDRGTGGFPSAIELLGNAVHGEERHAKDQVLQLVDPRLTTGQLPSAHFDGRGLKSVEVSRSIVLRRARERERDSRVPRSARCRDRAGDSSESTW